MNIAIAQQYYRVGDFAFNLEKIIRATEEAIEKNADLIVFGELCLSGYCHYDDIFYAHYAEACTLSIEKLLPLSKRIAIIVGGFRKNETGVGKPFYNSAFVLQHGTIQHTIDKTLLPYFDIFEEERYYERGTNNTKTIVIENKAIVLNVCADMWAYQKNSGYNKNPIREICVTNQKKDLIINLSASPFHYSRIEQRKEVIQTITREQQIPMIYCNIVGAYDETTFDGRSMVFDEKASCVLEMKAFEEDVQIIHIEQLPPPIPEKSKTYSAPIPSRKDEVIGYITRKPYIAAIYDTLLYNLHCFFKHTNTKKVLIASSGGIDSAVCLALVSNLLPKDAILSLSLPSSFSSMHSKQDAMELAKNLGIQHIEIPISDTYDHLIDKLHTHYTPSLKSITLENIQSRIRGTISMSIANNEGYLLINTSNKSELSTGYGTLYGDMIGAISPLGDLFKMQVYALAEHIQEVQHQCIPPSILEKAPSAELRENQKDEDSLPPYPVLDSILYFFLHHNKGKRELIHAGFDQDAVEKAISLFKQSQFKRKQFCPIIRVSDKAFGQGRKHIITSYYQYD